MSQNIFSPDATNRVDRPVRIGTALPSECRVGEIFFLLSQTPGENKLYGSFFLNIWTQIVDVDSDLLVPVTNQVQKAAVSLSSAQLKTITKTGDVRVQILAGVSGKTILPVGWMTKFNPVTTPYTFVAGQFTYCYDNAVDPETQFLTFMERAGLFDQSVTVSVPFAYGGEGEAVPNPFGQGISICGGVGSDSLLTLGDGTLTITIFYYLV